MSLAVRVSGRAKRDSDAIFDWIAQRSSEGALGWYKVYLSTLRKLPKHAAGCGRAPEAERLRVDLRQMLFKTPKGRVFRALFVIVENTVHVVAVRGAGQELVTEEDVELPD